MKKFEDFPLRERKQTKTRIGILDAALDFMRHRFLQDIKVDEICQVVEISKGTFFSYFPKKTDLIVYAIRLWSIGVGWEYLNSPESQRGLAYIRKLFHNLAQDCLENPICHMDIMAMRAYSPEIIQLMNDGNLHVVSDADRLFRYPNQAGILEIPEGTIVTYFRKNLVIAMERGELPGTIHVDSVLISLTSLLYGALHAAMAKKDIQSLPREYDRQLDILWAGLRTLYH